MSNIRLFFSEILLANMTGKLDKSQSHYLTKVMRINIDKNFSLFNQNGEWEARIIKNSTIPFIILVILASHSPF